MARDELDDEERELLARHRAEKAKRTDDDFEVEVGDGSGNYARLPYSRARNWLKKVANFDLDDEPEQDDEPEEPAKEAKPRAAGRGQAKAGGEVRAFSRRIG